MKVGDVIRRKDMPLFLYRIIGSSDQWKDMWSIELISAKRGLTLSSGMIAKDDDRWEVVPEKEKQ